MTLRFFSPFSLLPAALNHLLAREAWARAWLVPHAGKVAVLDAGVLAVRLKVGQDGLIETVNDEDATVTIHVRLADVPNILQDRTRAFSFVKIEGDADFANTLSRLSQSLRWEAEEDLRHVVGDIAARRIVESVRTTFSGIKATHQSIAENVAEYLLEEKPLLVRVHAMQDFAADVVHLRDDVARLAKRLEKIKGLHS